MYFFYFFPVGLDGSFARRPVLSWLLMTAMLVAFIWQRYLPDLGTIDPWGLVFYPGDGRPWTAVTAVFLHGSWLHLLGNLAYLHVFAPPLEDRLGRGLFLTLFIVLGVWGNLVHGAVSALGLLGQGGLGVLGASGAIAGLLAMALLRFYAARVQVAWWLLAPLAGQNRAGKSKVPVVAAILFWLVLQVVQTILAPETGATVSFGAHLGGFGLGLVLAALLGQRRAGRGEAAAARARAYYRRSNFYGAAGAWAEYLEQEPDDLEGWLELARNQKLTGQLTNAAASFARAYRGLMEQKQADEALRVYDEASRGGIGDFLTPQELSATARFKELQRDDEGALAVYGQLYKTYPGHALGHRALVRVIMLRHGRLADTAAAQHWLEEARRHLPPGTWRDFLEQEFNLAEASRAGAGAGPRADPGGAAP